MTARTSVYRRAEVRTDTLFELARGLRSEQHENAEYDRALVELVCEAAGLSMDYKEEVAENVGVEYLFDGSRVRQPFESMASEFESGWADAHSEHRDASLWESPFYRGGYLAGVTRPFPATPDVSIATNEALSVEGIKEVSLRQRNDGYIVGTAYDRHSGQEFDVRQTMDGWNVNDDEGIDYLASSLTEALNMAIHTESPA
jgi:hypothetical protein